MMDADDDDECMNAAAAHAAFVITILEARMYWLLRHAQHARYINIHKLHPLPEEIGVGCVDFLRDSSVTYGDPSLCTRLLCTVVPRPILAMTRRYYNS